MFKFEACEVLKIKEFAFANDCFQNKHNEEIGHYGVLFIMFKFEACEVLKIKEFAFANDCFQNKHNEEIGHYGQTLIKQPEY